MKVNINGDMYDVSIVRKKSNLHTYIRVKSDMIIYVTTNLFTSDRRIEKLIKDNIASIIKMIEVQKVKKNNNDTFYFLGRRYDIVYTDTNTIELGNERVFMGKNSDVDKWYRKQALNIFEEHLNFIYKNYLQDIPYPKLRIRKMTSRWGVCNFRKEIITLNLELIKRDVKYLDYVICHELAHLLEHNHSASFWKIVEKNCPDYKKIRKEMKEY